MPFKKREDRQVWFNNLVRVVERLVEFSTTLPANPTPEKNSGFLSLVCYDERALTHQRKIGHVPRDKETKYQILSEEKCLCLLREPACVSSYQLRDPDYGEYGMYAGAIRAISHLYGFSGLDQFIDEAVSVTAAYFMYDIDLDQVRLIKHTSNNPHIYPMIIFVDEVLRPELIG